MFYPFINLRVVESCTNSYILKGACASWSDTPDIKEEFGGRPQETIKSEAGCKTRCIMEYPRCRAIDYRKDSTCTTHSTAVTGTLLKEQGTIHSEIKAVPCHGKLCQDQILISSIQSG